MEQKDTCIEIDAGKSVVFKIDAKGGMFYSADNRLREIVVIDEKTAFQIMDSIANAVTHRSYLEPGNVQVALYDNRLKVTSPGMLLNGVTVEKIREGYLKVRNRAIANAYSYMKIIEEWGSGILRMFDEFSKYGLAEPELVDMDGDFRVNFYRKSVTS